MTEAEFQSQVIELCEKHSVKYFHSTDSRKDLGPGFPDLVLVGMDEVMFVELKTASGTLSARQTSWRYNLIAAGARYELWRPADLKSGVIDAYLRNL